MKSSLILMQQCEQFHSSVKNRSRCSVGKLGFKHKTVLLVIPKNFKELFHLNVAARKLGKTM